MSISYLIYLLLYTRYNNCLNYNNFFFLLLFFIRNKQSIQVMYNKLMCQENTEREKLNKNPSWQHLA